MKKILPIFLLLLVPLMLPLPTLADYRSAYNDYSFSYSQYRSAYNDYQISKSTFLTYHTLTAQSDAINKLRSVVKARDQVVFAYYNLLQEKLNLAPGITSDTRETFDKIKTSEKDWLAAHQTKIDAAGSMDDLNSISGEFESHYPQMDSEAKQTIGAILLAKEETLKSQLDELIANLNSKLTAIRQDGQDTTFADRGLINTKNKLDLFQAKLAQAHDVFSPTKSYSTSVDLLAGQQRLIESNQYLREATNFLAEIIKSLTG